MKALLIPALFAAGTLAARLTLYAAPAAFRIDLAQPIPVVTNWGTAGLPSWGILCVMLTAAGAVFMLTLRQRRSPPLALTLLIGAAAMLAGLFWVPLFSSDVYAYAAYGEMARLGLDPYVHHPLLHDPIVAAARWQWSGTLPICVYGVAFVDLARAVVTLAHGLGTVVVLNVLRALACGALLLAAWLAAAMTDDETRAGRVAFFIACNPLALWAAIEGHNDTLMLAAVLAGIVVLRRFPFIGAAIVALAATIKLPALGAAFAIAAQRIVERRNGRLVLAGTLAGTALVVASAQALIHGVRTTMAPQAVYHPMASVQALGPIVAAIAAIAVVMRIRAFASPADRWCVAALALWIAIPNPYPWYALWIIPIAAFAHDQRVVAATLAVAAAAVLRYLPDAVAIPGTVDGFVLGLLALAAYAPLAWRRGVV